MQLDPERGSSPDIDMTSAALADTSGLEASELSPREARRKACLRLEATLDRMHERYGADPEVQARITALKTNAVPAYGGQDLVRQYLNEVSGYDLLTEAEQRAASETLRAGLAAEDEADTLPEGTVLPVGTVLPEELVDKIKDGIVAHEELYLRNLRLVISIAQKYSFPDIDLLDLIQEGNLGLRKSVVRFDPTLGFKFSTYATWHIRQTITRAIADKSRAIRLPVHMHDRVLKIRRAGETLMAETAEDPTPADIAKRAGMTAEEVVAVQGAERFTVSLSTPTGRNQIELGQMLSDSGEETQLAIEGLSDREELARILAAGSLRPREELVLSLHFGVVLDRLTHKEFAIEGGTVRYDELIGRALAAEDGFLTFEEIGEALGVTRERIRQIQNRALKKLFLVALQNPDP